MAAITLCLPPTGLIGCLGEFLREMGNESNIYCRVRAGGDIHCINLTWPPLQRQKAGLWEGHASWRADSEETEVQVGIWKRGETPQTPTPTPTQTQTQTQTQRPPSPFDLCCSAFSRKSGSVYGELCCCKCVCVRVCVCVLECVCVC